MRQHDRWTRRAVIAGLAGTTTALALSARAQTRSPDKVKVGVFPVSSSLPYFVALERGYFKDEGIEPEMTRLMGGPPTVAAMITNQIEAAAVLVMLEGMNANAKKPGVATYISANSQTKTWQMEQFVVRTGFKASSIKDLKGAKLMSAPGPANLNVAKAILARNGLNAADYTIDQLDMGQHVNVMVSGTFDGGYTLEPQATVMRKMGVARTLESGLIAKYVLGDDSANAFAGGCALTADFIAQRPDVAKRFAGAWSKAVDLINKQPSEARKHLAKNTLTPDDVVGEVPMLGYVMVKDMTPKQMSEWQKFVDFGTEIGLVPEKLDVAKFSKAL